jgi:hypothetical protein
MAVEPGDYPPILDLGLQPFQGREKMGAIKSDFKQPKFETKTSMGIIIAD